MKLYKAFCTCNSCGQYDEYIGSSPEDAALLLRHSHGQDHILQGEVRTEQVTDPKLQYDLKRKHSRRI